MSMSKLYLTEATIKQYYLIKPSFGHVFLINQIKDQGTR